MENILHAKRFTIIDGGLGTMLQAAGMPAGMPPELFALRQPEALLDIHRAYVAAGADIITACTFGANAKKLAGSGENLNTVIQNAISLAKQAAAGKALTALDVGPLGEMLEPGGTLSFDDAYALFAEVMQAGQDAGAELIIIETMGDLYETKAAVLAAQEHTKLPVMVSMSFEADGRSFAGVPVESFAAAIGAMRPLAIGLNCSLGPTEIMPILKRLCAASPVPVFAMPNAGLPDAQSGAYSLSPADFLQQMKPCEQAGVVAVGGCCGTSPEAIRLLTEHFKPLAPLPLPAQTHTQLCGPTRFVSAEQPLAIGERINPTGKPRLRQALLEENLDYVMKLAVEQEEAGADILDINVGAPGVDEVALLPKVVRAVQSVTGLPLQLDSANPAALAAALRVTCGKPLVNSTTGEADKMAAILPLCARYGAAVAGLTLDEAGIPETAEGRLKIAANILQEARQYGLAKTDVVIDCLTMSAAAQPGAANVTLAAVQMVKQTLDLATMLGVSNISFGLPNRPLANRSFFAAALQAGLDFAIINPADEGMMGTLLTLRMLKGQEADLSNYVSKYSDTTPESKPNSTNPAGNAGTTLKQAIMQGLKKEAAAMMQAALDKGEDGMALINSQLMPALDEVGKGFELKKVFLPQLLAAANAATAAFDVVRAAAAAKGEAPNGPPVVIATVQGDVHDIGKNIAKVLLENYGFNVIDLGRDVPPETILAKARSSGTKLVGLSALMTTTLPAMEATVQLLRRHLPGCHIMCGGAVLTESYVKSIGADLHAKDAAVSAEYARKIHGM